MAGSERHSDVPLIGRGAALRALGAALAAAGAGRGAVVVIEGDPGTGKTRLVNEALALAEEHGFTVCSDRGDEIERARPFGPLVRALDLDPAAGDPDRAALGRLLTRRDDRGDAPTLLAGMPDAQFAVLDGIVSLVDRLCTSGPLLLAVDDLHWADPSTFLALAAIARRIGALPAALAVSLRRAPRPPELDAALAVLTADDATCLELGGFDEAEVRELVERMLGARPGPRLLEAAGAAGGNPFFLVELLSALAATDDLERGGDEVDLRETDLPPAVQEPARLHLRNAAPETRDLLRYAAVLGSRFTVEELAAFWHRAVPEVVAALEDATGVGLLTDMEGAFTFRHDLVRDAAYEEISPAARAALHAEAGRVLARQRAEPLRVARHLALGARRGDTEAVTWLRQAARDTGPGSPEVALALLDRALELATDPQQRSSLRGDQVEVLTWSGHVAEVETLAGRLVEEVDDPSERSRLLRHRSVALLLEGRVAEAIADLERAVAESPEAVDRGRVLAETALLRMASGDQQGAEASATDALASTEVTGDAAGRSLALSMLSRVEAFRLDLPAALRHADAAVATAAADASGDSARYVPDFFRALVLHDLDRLDEVSDTVRRARSGATPGGALSQPLMQGLAAFTALRAGALDDAAAEARAGLSLSLEAGARFATVWCQSVLGLAALHTGDVETARDAAAEAEAAFQASGALLGIDLMVLLQARLDALAGNADLAVDRLHGGWQVFTDFGFALNCHVLGPALARAALAADRREIAEEVAARLEADAARLRLASLEGAARLVRGLVARDAESMLEAVAAYGQSPRLLETVAACEDAAEVLRGHDRTQAVALLEEALRSADHCGADADADRVDRKLRQLAPRRRKLPRRPTTGWDSLTESETAVVALVGEGLTNAEIAARLFVSRRTVESHLYRVYPKLGLSSRVELSRQAAQRFQ